MFKVSKFNHETNKTISIESFETKRKANAFVKENGDKFGYDFFLKSNRSIEFQKLY